MEFTSTNVLTIVLGLTATAAVWGGMQSRVGRLEKDFEASKAAFDTALATLRNSVEEKMRDFQGARERQGERIGDVEKSVEALLVMNGRAPTTRRRTFTKPGGEKT